MIKMRTFFFASLLFQVGCFSSSFSDLSLGIKDIPVSEPKLHHLVFCWLKDSGNREHRNRIMQACEKFRKIPGVLRVATGEVVLSDRAIVEDSYDVGLLVVVEDEEALRKYLDHPIHQKAKKEVLLPLVGKVLVYDFKNR